MRMRAASPLENFNEISLTDIKMIRRYNRIKSVKSHNNKPP
jgi:hypothetical protein